MKPSQQIHALKKQVAQLQSQIKKQRLFHLQEKQLLQCQIQDYRRLDIQTKKLNQTVISSYKNNDHARDQILQTSLQDLTKKHKEELQRIVTCHAKNINALQAQIKGLKEKLESNSDLHEHNKFEIERGVRIKLEEETRKQKEQLQSEIRELKNKNIGLESKLRKSQHLLKTYRQHMNKIDYESQKNEILKNTSVQYSWLSQIDKKREDEDMMSSRMYKSKGRTEFEQSNRMIRSQTNILCSADLKTNYERKYDNDRNIERDRERERERDRQRDRVQRQIAKQRQRERQKQNRLVKSNRRKSFIDDVGQSARKSRKYLQINRQSIENLTSRISQAVSSLEKMKKGIPGKKISEVINQKLQRKLKLR